MPLPSASPLAALYRSHHGWLFGWLRKKLGCPENAADAAQDTFAKLIGRDELESLQEPRAYLLVAANRLLINQYHRRRVEEETLRSMAVLMEQENVRSPERIAAQQELLGKVLLLLLDELDEKPRKAFLMARIDGCSYVEIARHLQVSESSVKQYLARTLAHLHGRLFDALADGVGHD
ncbi:putative RNA polymerase sigma factor FecI [compost metagenome]